MRQEHRELSLLERHVSLSWGLGWVWGNHPVSQTSLRLETTYEAL